MTLSYLSELKSVKMSSCGERSGACIHKLMSRTLLKIYTLFQAFFERAGHHRLLPARRPIT